MSSPLSTAYAQDAKTIDIRPAPAPWCSEVGVLAPCFVVSEQGVLLLATGVEEERAKRVALERSLKVRDIIRPLVIPEPVEDTTPFGFEHLVYSGGTMAVVGLVVGLLLL